MTDIMKLADALQNKANCGCCNGTGWVVRDPDIGTDQECFCCNGSGKAEMQDPIEQLIETSQNLGLYDK